MAGAVDSPMDSSPPTPGPDIDAVVAGLRARVDQRRRAGEYPPGLEEDLEAELRRIVEHRPAQSSGTRRSSVREALELRGGLPPVDPSRVAGATASSVPGGAALHAAVARVVGHQTAGVLSQVQDISNATWDALLVLADAVAALEASLGEQRPVVAILDALVERVAAFERAPASSPVGMGELARRIERLEAAEASRLARPWFSSDLPIEVPGGAAGSRAVPGAAWSGAAGAGDIASLADGLEGFEPVLVLGAESDELLAALGREGLDARGGGGGAGALAGLASEPDRSLGALVVAGFVEHLGPGHVLDLVREAAEKLRPGGRLRARALNPRSLWGLAHGAAGRPDRALVDPGWLALCCREAGFCSVELAWSEAPGCEDRDDELRRVIFGPLFYTIVASR